MRLQSKINQSVIWTAFIFLILALSWDQSVAQTITQKEGQIRTYVGDDFANKRAEVFATLYDKLSGQEFALKFKDGKTPAWLREGMQVRVRGSVRQLNLSVESLEQVAGSADSNSGSVGDSTAALSGRSVVVLLLNFTDGTHYMSKSSVDSVMFGASDSVTDMYNKSTSGLISFVRDSNGDGDADIYGPFDLNVSGANCDYNLWASEGVKAASAAGIDTSSAKFQHIIYVLPQSAQCGWWGLGGGRQSWVRYGGMMVYAHELGHNLGMHHAGTDTNNDGAIESEYGDYSCVMGNSSNVAGINGAHLMQLGTYNSFPDKIVNGTRGQYTVSPLDWHPLTATGAQIVRIPKANTSEYYYLTYRQPYNYGTRLSSTYLRGLNIHVFRGSGFVQTRFIAAIAVGETFSDPANGVEITALSQASDGSGFTFSVNAECVSASPTVAISPSSQYVAPAGQASYSVSIKNNDNPMCPSTQFSLAAQADAGFSGSLSSSSVQIAAGATTSVQLTGATSLSSGTGAISVQVADNDGQDPAHSSVQAQATMTVDSFAPTAPSNLQASQSKGKVNLTWSASSDVGGGVASYKVIRDGNVIANVSSTSYTDSSAAAGSTVAYSVVAVDRAGNQSSASNSVTVTVTTNPGKGRKPR